MAQVVHAGVGKLFNARVHAACYLCPNVLQVVTVRVCCRLLLSDLNVLQVVDV